MGRTKSVQATCRSASDIHSSARRTSVACSQALSSRQQISPIAPCAATSPAVTAAIAWSSSCMPSATRPVATLVSPSSAMASNSRSASPKRLAIVSAEAAHCSRSFASRVNTAPSRISQPCAAHSSTPSSRLWARPIHPLATAQFPW